MLHDLWKNIASNFKILDKILSMSINEDSGTAYVENIHNHVLIFFLGGSKITRRTANFAGQKR